MTGSQHHGQWQVQPREGSIRLKTNRIGFFSVNATAPIVGGAADWSSASAELVFQVGINEVKTGNALLDPEVHALIARGSDGVLTFDGAGHAHDAEVRFEGTAKAGDIEVPLVLTGSAQGDEQDTRNVAISGTATFDDVHIPLPGFSHVKHIDVHIEGLLRLTRG